MPRRKLTVLTILLLTFLAACGGALKKADKDTNDAANEPSDSAQIIR